MPALSLTLFFLLSFCYSFSQPVLSEILSDPDDYSDSEAEFIEIYCQANLIAPSTQMESMIQY